MNTPPNTNPAAAGLNSGDALRGIVDAAPVAMLVSDRKGVIALANAEARRLLGYTETELRGLAVAALLAKEYLGPLEAFLARFWQKPESRPVEDGPEFPMRRKDGREVWVQLGFNPVTVEGTVYALGALLDISERKRATEALRENRRLLATLLDNLPGMAYRCLNDEHWTMQFVSGGCIELTGYRAEDLIGNRMVAYEELILPEDRSHVRREVEAALRLDAKFDVTYRIRTAEGAIKWLSERGRGVLPEDSAPLVLEGFIFDVTARKRAEHERAESERTMRAILDHSFEFIGLLDTEGRMLRANHTSLQESGVRWEEVQGHYFWETPWWRHSSTEQNRLRAAVARAAGGEFVRYETTHSATGGRLLDIDFSLKPVRDELGLVTALIPEGRDITERKCAEQALRESEEKFSKAFRASPDAISLSDLSTGRFLDVNEGYERLSGYARSELIGRTSLELGIWADNGDRDRLLAGLARHGSVREIEIKARTRSGKLNAFMLSAEKVEIGGRPCVVIISRDITARLAAEQAVRESEEKFATAFQLSPDIMSISDYETGCYTEVNAAHEKLFGFTRAECIGKSPADLGIVGDSESGAEMRQRLEEERRIHDFKVDAKTRSGRKLVLLMSAEIIRIGGRQCILRASRDLTAMIQSEEATRQSEEKFAKAFHLSPYSQTISELATGRYLDVNAAFEKISGYSRLQVIGHTSAELGLWQNAADREKLVRRLQGGGSVRGMEIVFRRRDGANVTTLCSCEVVEIGGVRCLLNTIEDVTEQRRIEQEKIRLEGQLRQSQKLEALGTLAGGIAHDFNNILTAMIVYRELALMDIEHPVELRKHLAEIGQASNRAKELVRQILTFSRQQKQERRTVQLHPVVREALQLLRSSLPSTIEMDLHIDEQAPEVLADTGQVHQIVMNLATNAAHAMRGRPGRLTVELVSRQIDREFCRLHSGLRPGLYAQLSVADTGHGMDESTLAHIFEPFFTTKAPGEGTGLGLAVVHGIMQDHDGAVTVQSQLNEGTRFDLFFPQHVGASRLSLENDATIPQGRGESVLLIDDEQLLCEAIGAMLKKIGYRVTAHTDPVEAVKAFALAPGSFDLVITDQTMPRMTGLDVVREIYAIRPAIPVLLATGLSGDWSPAKLRSFNIRELVAKPLDLAGLAQVVRRALDQSQSG